jgi:hypothetical protein
MPGLLFLRFCLVFKVHQPRKPFSKGIKGTFGSFLKITHGTSGFTDYKGTFGSFLKFKSIASPAAAAAFSSLSMKLLVSWIPSGQIHRKTVL